MKREVMLERKARAAYKGRHDDSVMRGELMFALMMKSHELTEKCLKKVPEVHREQYIEQHLEKVFSECHSVGYSILWGPNSQVISQFERVNGKSILSAVWTRRAFKAKEKILLRQELINRFNG